MAEIDTPTFNALLRKLEAGESAAKAQRFSMTEASNVNFNSVLLDMRRSINTAATRMREATGNNFRVESGMMITTDKDSLIAVVVVTRED